MERRHQTLAGRRCFLFDDRSVLRWRCVQGLTVRLCAQNQDVVPISSYDTAGSFLILGCNNGSIYYIGESGRPLAATGRTTPSGQ